MKNFPLSAVTLMDSDFLPRREATRRYLHSLEVDRLTYNFCKNAGILTCAQPLGGWEAPGSGIVGHFTGHYLSACAKFYASDGDTALKGKAEEIIAILARCQQESGYLSAFPEDMLDHLEEELDRNAQVPYYTLAKILMGLTDCARLMGSEQAKACALKLAGYIAGRFRRLSYWQIDGMLRCTRCNPLNEFGNMGDALYCLYELTGETWILELAKVFDRPYFVGNLSAGRDLLEDLHANTHLPQVLSALHRYQLTGEDAYRQAGVHFVRFLDGRTFANGSSSSRATHFTHFLQNKTSETAEHWGAYGHLENALTGGESESCCGHNTERVLARLLDLTGDASYAARMARLKYNAVLNSTSAKTGLSQYHQKMGMHVKKEFSTPYDSFWCCTASGVEAMSEVQSNIYLHHDNCLLVQHYVSSVLCWAEKGLKISQVSDFPDGESARLTFETQVRVDLELWFREGTLSGIAVNGESVKAVHEGGFIKLRHCFENQDTVELTLCPSLRTEALQGSVNRCALLYGDILLAAIGECRAAGMTREELVKNAVRVPGQLRFEVKDKAGETTVLMPLFRVEDETYSVYLEVQ